MTFDTRAPLSIQASRTINVGRGSGALPTIVWDGFESADMSAPDGPAPYLNRDGFTWGSNNRTSVVTRNEDGNVAVWNNGPIYNINTDPGLDWTAFSGDYCLRFRYRAGEPWTEQRFNFTGEPKELWMAFWIRIPTNFDTTISGSTKFFSIWMDGYSAGGDGSTVWMDYNGSGEMRITHSIGRYNASSGYQGLTKVFDPIEDRGKWIEFVVRVVTETSEDADDGIMQVWKRADGDLSYIKTHETFDWRLRVPDSGPQGWSRGYLLGWVDQTYSEDTDWLLDDFKLSETSLLEG